MRLVPALCSSVIFCGLFAIRLATAADAPPAWAYTPNNPDYKPPIDDGKPVRVPDSTAGYTWSQLRDRFIAPVWHPSDHGALPEVVANGRKPGVFACGFCHRATGTGGPENADLAGLPKSYIIQQMADYKSGARGTALPGRTPPKLMIELSKLATDAEIEAAAAYFSALQPRKRIEVVESDTAPKTYVAGLLWAALETGERDPIGVRIVEVPDDLLRFESRDPRSTFTAHVPVGSLARRGACYERTMRVVPWRRPERAWTAAKHCWSLTSYMFRQLYDFRHGARAGEWSPLMVQAVATLDEQSLLAIVAYLASRDP
jgi:cytochrome c553